MPTSVPAWSRPAFTSALWRRDAASLPPGVQPGAMIGRRAALAAGLLATCTAQAQTQGVTLRLAQYKAGDQLLLRLAGLDDAPYRAEWAEFGSGNLMLEAVAAGLSWSDIQPVNLSPADGQAAFRAGNLDAWAIYGYSVPLAKQAGARVRVRCTAAGVLSGSYPYFAAPDALADPLRRAAIAGHLRRLALAFRWMDAHHAKYAAAQAPLVGVPAAAVQELLDGASQPRRLVPPDDAAVASHQAAADAFHRAGLLPRTVDVSPLWDRSFELGDV